MNIFNASFQKILDALITNGSPKPEFETDACVAESFKVLDKKSSLGSNDSENASHSYWNDLRCSVIS